MYRQNVLIKGLDEICQGESKSKEKRKVWEEKAKKDRKKELRQKCELNQESQIQLREYSSKGSCQCYWEFKKDNNWSDHWS